MVVNSPNIEMRNQLQYYGFFKNKYKLSFTNFD